MTTARNRHSPILLKGLIISVFTLLTLVSEAPAGNMIAQKGQKALLEYTIEIEGRAAGTNNNYHSQKWSTLRTLKANAILIAQHPSAQDPGDPGGQHRAFSKSKSGNTEFKPSNETAKYMAEMEKCGNDMNCRMRIAQKMQNDPNVMADMNKGKKIAKSEKGAGRYQIWTVERKASVTGNVKVDVKTESLFKTAVDELTNCTETAEVPFEKLISGSTWPATIKIDAQTGTYAANIDIPSKTFLAKVDCTVQAGRERSERHETSGRKFLPERYQQASLEDIEVFRGGADGASGGRRLAHGEKIVTGIYGDLVGNVPMAAKITVRWSITLKD